MFTTGGERAYAKRQRGVPEVGMRKKVTDFLPGPLQLERVKAAKDITVECLLV